MDVREANGASPPFVLTRCVQNWQRAHESVLGTTDRNALFVALERAELALSFDMIPYGAALTIIWNGERLNRH